MNRPIRDFEWAVLKPLLRPGCSILEFGNKKNKLGVYKDWYEQQGYRHVSVDWNGADGAIKLDFRHPMQGPLESVGLPRQYDIVTNSGTLEHVETNLEAAWKNCFDLTKEGGHQVHITPAAGEWQAHGLYHPTWDFFKWMASCNAMTIIHLDNYAWTKGKS